MEDMMLTIAQASNVKMQIEKHRRKRREIIVKLTLAIARTKMKITIIVTTIMMKKMIIAMIMETPETTKRSQKMENKMKIQMHNFEWNSISLSAIINFPHNAHLSLNSPWCIMLNFTPFCF